MNHQPDSPVNLDQLKQISEGDIEFEIEVLRVYIEDISQRIEKIREAIANNDWTRIMAEAHHLRGSSANVGVLSIQMLAIQVEKLNRGEDSEKALEIINDMLMKVKAVELFIAERSATLSLQKAGQS